MALLYSLGRPWKRSVIYNTRLTVWLLVMTIFCTAILFANSQAGLFEDEVSLDSKWRGLIFLFVAVNVVVSSVYELLIFPRLVQLYKDYKKRGAGEVATVYGRIKNLTGPNAKEYHTLRGQFEKNWTTL
jgi:hypothetical protein